MERIGRRLACASALPAVDRRRHVHADPGRAPPEAVATDATARFGIVKIRLFMLPAVRRRAERQEA